ncbi:MAG: DUF4038 domain-containing protein [Lachnospiraceae bacterium]|jgi:hypothetical protein|nr:DUF4038 domain-containing protein [Lachnospiraceae bacterium]
MIKNQLFELIYNGMAPDDKINIDMQTTYYHQNKSVTVKGFYDGNGIYKVRFLPEETGDYTWETKGLFNDCGRTDCKQGKEKGIVRAKGTGFVRDGKLFHPFGTTVYALIHQPPDLVKRTLETLKQSPFNKVRMCVFPKYYDWNHNEPDNFAFFFDAEGKPDTNNHDFIFWQQLETYIAILNEMDIQCDLILFHPYDKWGFAKMDMSSCMRYLDYATRRLSAFPNIWWSLANEYDIMVQYLERFSEFAEYVSSNDPYKHLLSNHQMFSPWDFSNQHTTHVSTQTKDINRTRNLMKRFSKPIVYDEVRYEGNLPYEWGNLTPQMMTDSFWRICVCGAYCTHGETYITDKCEQDEILWWAKGGELKGTSPARIAYLKKLIEALPGKLEPIDHAFSIDPTLTYEELLLLFKEHRAPKYLSPVLQILSSEGFEVVKHMNECNIGHIGESVYLYYLADQAPVVYDIELPENGSYDVHIIDTWEMESEIQLHGVNGKVRIKLPQKLYMAILAVICE